MIGQKLNKQTQWGFFFGIDARSPNDAFMWKKNVFTNNENSHTFSQNSDHNINLPHSIKQNVFACIFFLFCFSFESTMWLSDVWN